MERRALAIFLTLLAGCTERDHGARPGPDAALPAASTTPAASAWPQAAESAPGRAPAPAAPLPLPPPSLSALPPTEWIWKPYRGERFTVLFPGQPTITDLPADDERAGGTVAKLDIPGGQVSFAATFTDHSEEEVAKADTFLDARANPPRRGITDVLHKRVVTLPGGQPGRVLILRRDISGTPLRIYSRLYLVGRRLYSLIVSTLDVGGVTEDVVKKFMESFKLL